MTGNKTDTPTNALNELQLSRRSVLRTTTASLGMATGLAGTQASHAFAQDASLSASPATTPQSISITGVPVPALAVFDQVITDLLTAWKISGATFAVAKDGRLVFDAGMASPTSKRRSRSSQRVSCGSPTSRRRSPRWPS